MLKLSLVRHAQSSRDDPEQDDHERQLTKRGTKSARHMGRYIADNDLVPDLILCSDSIRTLATLTLMRPAFADTPPLTLIKSELYHATPDTIIDVVSTEGGTSSHVMVIGHNPGIHALALTLSNAGHKRDLTELAMQYPTTGLAHFHFAIDAWRDLATATGTLERFVTPRSLTG